MFAPGAIACAYSTSSDVSTPQSRVSPEPIAPVPRALMILNDGGDETLKEEANRQPLLTALAPFSELIVGPCTAGRVSRLPLADELVAIARTSAASAVMA